MKFGPNVESKEKNTKMINFGQKLPLLPPKFTHLGGFKFEM